MSKHDEVSILSRAERALLHNLSHVVERTHQFTGPVFILASPRTGSTLLYQLLAASLGLPYLDNLTNHCFAATPLVGLAIRAGAIKMEISFSSAYGKTDGPWQPSEASNIMRAWFGSGHPSELVSSGPLPGKEAHIRATVRAAYALFGKPLLIKNAWNCFRIPSLRKLFPDAAFIWLKRDIGAAAVSDLAARYVTKNDPNAWNSATPRNYELLRQRPYWEQVVENQFEFARAVSDGLVGLPKDQRAEIWYEDLCSDLSGQIHRLVAALACLRATTVSLPQEEQVFRSRGSDPMSYLQSSDLERVQAHVEGGGARFEPLRHARRSAS